LAALATTTTPNSKWFAAITRRIASNIAKLPELLGKVRPDDNIQAVGNLSDERHEAEDTTPKGEP